MKATWIICLAFLINVFPTISATGTAKERGSGTLVIDKTEVHRVGESLGLLIDTSNSCVKVGILTPREFGLLRPVPLEQIWQKIVTQVAEKGILTGVSISVFREAAADGERCIPLYLNPRRNRAGLTVPIRLLSVQGKEGIINPDDPMLVYYRGIREKPR